MVRWPLVWMVVWGGCPKTTTDPQPASTAAVRAAPALVPQLGHVGSVDGAELSEGGRRLLTFSADGRALWWDVATGLRVRAFTLHRGGLTGATLSPDDRQVAIVTPDFVGVFDTQDGSLLTRLEGPYVGQNVAWSPDGRRLVTDFAIWDAASGEPLAVVAEAHGAAKSEGNEVAFAPDGTTALLTSYYNPPLLVDATTGDVRHRLDAHTDEVFASTYSPDGSRIVTASYDGQAIVWDTASGRPLHRLDIGDSQAEYLVFSPDGSRFALQVVDETTAIVETDSGRILAQLTLRDVDDSVISDVAFSPDGRSLLATGGRDLAVIWQPDSDQITHRLQLRGRRVYDAVWSPDGSQVVVTHMFDPPSATIWDARTGELLQDLRGSIVSLTDAFLIREGTGLATMSEDHVLTLWSTTRGRPELQLSLGDGKPGWRRVVVSPTSQHLVFPAKEGAALWNVDAGVRVAMLEDDRIRRAAFSKDGGILLTTGREGHAALWDPVTGERRFRLEGHGSADVWSHAIAPDGTHAITADAKGAAVLWSALDGAVLERVDLGGPPSFVDFTPSGTRLVLATDAGGLAFVDFTTGDLTFEAPRYERPVSSVVFSADERLAAVAHMSYERPFGRLEIRDGQTGALLHQIGHPTRVHWLAFSADGSQLLTVSGEDVAVWNSATGSLVHRWNHDGFVRSARFVHSDQRVLSSGDDGTARLWDVRSGEQLVATLTAEEGGWAVVDPSGRFDASDDGNLDALAWVIDDTPYQLSQLRTQFYDPGLLAKALGEHAEPPRSVPDLGRIPVPARVHLTGPTPAGDLTVRLEDRGGGVGTVLLRLNGSDVTSVLQGCKDLTSKECTVSLRGQPTWIEGGVNRVAAEAGNRDDTVRSRGLDLSVEADGLLATDPPELWVLAVGVSDYAGDDLDLDFAAEDAQELSNALRLAGHHGFAKPNTHVRVLTTSGGERPSHTALTDAFRWLEASEPHDTVIVFLAGHGVAMADPARGVDDYFYLLPDARSLDDVRDPQLRALRAWSGTQLADALSQVGALKRVVILDTCAAGRAHTSLLAQRDLSSDAIRAHARARERTGAWLLAGAAADQVSYEASRYGQGVLTYTLLDGMRGPAVDGANQLLVSRLFAHAETHVQTNARGVGGIQIPVVRRGEGDFPIGAMPPEARSAIEVRRLRPVMVRSSVQGEGGRRDTLGFADLLDAALRDASAQPDAPFVAWDSPPAPDTWQITGQIVASEDSLRFEGFLTWQGEAVKEHPISAAAADLDALTTVVLQQVRSAL